MTTIQKAINKTPITSSATPTQIDTIAQAISTQLNTLWEPAWNVIIANSPAGKNTIVYGYAFRNHWMWINGLTVAGNPMTWSYIIWKDYNCQAWTTYGDMFGGGSTFLQGQFDIFNVYKASGDPTDIWALAHTFVEYVNAHQLFNTGAYTAIMSESQNVGLSGYICMVNRNYLSQAPFGGNADGAVFLFQTRQDPS